MIKYADIVKESVVDGPGVRLVVFLQGCIRNCEGCHNPELQLLEGGKKIHEKELASLLVGFATPLHRGITFSGGEPLLQFESLRRVISEVRKQKPELDIWVFTGYLFEDVKMLPVMEMIDVLVDGPFELSKRNLSLDFRGSYNQRLIDVTESLKKGAVVKITSF